MSDLIVEGAKVMAKGQITLPKDIRDKLKVGTGDRLVLIWDGDRVILMNSGVFAMRALQRDLEGVAAATGLDSEDDVAELVAEVRASREGS